MPDDLAIRRSSPGDARDATAVEAAGRASAFNQSVARLASQAGPGSDLSVERSASGYVTLRLRRHDERHIRASFSPSHVDAQGKVVPPRFSVPATAAPGTPEGIEAPQAVATTGRSTALAPSRVVEFASPVEVVDDANTKMVKLRDDVASPKKSRRQRGFGFGDIQQDLIASSARDGKPAMEVTDAQVHQVIEETLVATIKVTPDEFATMPTADQINLIYLASEVAKQGRNVADAVGGVVNAVASGKTSWPKRLVNGFKAASDTRALAKKIPQQSREIGVEVNAIVARTLLDIDPRSLSARGHMIETTGHSHCQSELVYQMRSNVMTGQGRQSSSAAKDFQAQAPLYSKPDGAAPTSRLALPASAETGALPATRRLAELEN